ncbi:TIR domain-containing protein [Leptolyngbya sp. CCNP1308]|uniref:TIR domain-containing protein n=1 Tax=Leptolyngbya sp. CCNP1308 TaxID=3110255 RepID=UPI003A598F7B
MAGEALDVFISYSRRDERLKDELVDYHLKLLQREGKIKTWQDLDIEAGAEWAAEIKANLEKADIVLLLITRHFLASDYCYETEMQRAVQRHYEGTVKVIPIILETCGWQYSNFSQLQALPKDGKPITRWEDKAEAFFDVEEGIRQVVASLNVQRREAIEVKEREAEKLKRQQEETARWERERQERERLAQEQREREQVKAQKKAQKMLEEKRREQERLVAEQRRSEDKGLEQEKKQQEPDNSQEASKDFLNRRKVLWSLVGSLGWLVALISTVSRFFDSDFQPTIHPDNILSSTAENISSDKIEGENSSQINSSNTSLDNNTDNAFGFGSLDMAALILIPLIIFGPKKLPDIARSLGKAVKGFQDASREFEEEFKKESAKIEVESLKKQEKDG